MKTKKCNHCKRTKVIEKFSNQKSSLDGRAPQCKTCKKKYAKSWYWRNREYALERDRNHRRKPESLERKKVYEHRHRLKYPGKNKARKKFSNAVRDGRVQRKSCQSCGEPESQGHHYDYRKPLEVIWLCFRCHAAEHGKLVTDPRKS